MEVHLCTLRRPRGCTAVGTTIWGALKFLHQLCGSSVAATCPYVAAAMPLDFSLAQMQIYTLPLGCQDHSMCNESRPPDSEAAGPQAWLLMQSYLQACHAEAEHLLISQ